MGLNGQTKTKNGSFAVTKPSLERKRLYISIICMALLEDQILNMFCIV